MTLPAIRFRHPGEEDHLRVARLVDGWWETRGARTLLPRLWFRHFAATAWLAETDDDRGARVVGFVAGFVGADRPAEAGLLLIGVDPNLRRRGIGRALVERFVAGVGELGVTSVETVVWAGDRAAIGFLRAVGFVPDDGPGTSSIYGIRAYADYDTLADDKALLVLALDAGTGPSGG